MALPNPNAGVPTPREMSWKGEMKTHPMIARTVKRMKDLPPAVRMGTILCAMVMVPLLILQIFSGGRFIRYNAGGSAAGDNDYNGVALVTIATGGYDASALVQSARTKGQWRGRFFVISDGSSPTPDECHVIHVKPPADSLYAVAFKAQLLDLISLKSFPAISRLVYLDCDMLLNAPVVDFLQAFGSWDTHADCAIYMVRERWYTKSDWNSGTIVIDRGESAFMLKKWEKLIVDNHDEIMAQNTYAKDQWALTKLVDDYRICPLPDRQVAFVADMWGRISIPLMHLGLLKPATFVHYTSAKNDKSAPHFKTPMTKGEMNAAAAAATAAGGGGGGDSDLAATGHRLLMDEGSSVAFKRRESTGFVTREHAPERTPHTSNFQMRSHDARKRRGGIRVPQHVQMRQRLPGGAETGAAPAGVHQAIHHGELPVGYPVEKEKKKGGGEE